MKGKRQEQRIRIAAAGWLEKSIRGFTPEEQDKFFEWLAEDGRNAKYFAECKRTWSRMDNLALWAPEHSDSPNQDLLKPFPKMMKFYRFSALGVAAALSVFGTLWFLSPQNYDTETFQKKLTATSYESEDLPDGSVIELNSGSELKIEFSQEQRKVELLSNEAHFVVAKDLKRPFIVEAKGIRITAVGTSFNVKVYNDDVEVLVTEGVVKMGAIGEGSVSDVLSSDSELTVGELLVVSSDSLKPETEVKKPSVQELDSKLSWKPKMFEYDSTPLWKIVDELNMRNRVQIEIADPELEDVSIVASLRSSSVEHFIDLLMFSVGIEVEYLDEDRVKIWRKSG